MISTVTANRMGSYLAAARGWVDKNGGLMQMQLVWGIRDCALTASPSPAAPAAAPAAPPAKAASPSPSPAAAKASPSPSPKPAAAPSPAIPPINAIKVSPAPSPAPKASPAASPAAAPAASQVAAPAASSDVPAAAQTTPGAASPAPAPSPAAPPSKAAASCAPKPAMCDTSPASTYANTCKVAAPFTAPQCVGGCCVSSGKCKYGSCVANGLGRDASMTCFGQNALPNMLALLNNRCGHLACKLAVPGCKTSLMGGNCVGTVVAVGGDGAKLHPFGAQYVGAPCVETTATGGVVPMPKLIDLRLPAAQYVSAAWKVCDCADAAAAAPGGGGPTVVKLPSVSLSSLFGLGAKNGSGTVVLAPSPSPADGALPETGGDVSLGAGSTFASMKDLMLGGMSKGNADPFADFLGTEEVPADEALLDAEAAAMEETAEGAEGAAAAAAGR
jgi:hypothetical protein